MKASKIKTSKLRTYQEMTDAIESIENDYQNIVGGIKAWNSGYETKLTKTAENKIAAIEAKMDKIVAKAEETS